MPYYAIDGSAKQYQKANGSFAANYYLKFYAAGTSTAIQVAPNASATDSNNQPQLLDKIQLNERGYPINPSGGVMIPHLDQAYKIILYKNAADANANNTSAAEWTIDNVSPGLIGFGLTLNDQTAAEIDYSADPSATTRTIESRLQERISILDFAADNTGVTDCTTAISTALLSGTDIFIPSGTYLCSGIKVLRDYQNIHFGGIVTLKAAANSDIMFWQTASGCKHTGYFTIDANGKSDVWAMCVGPSDLSSQIVVDSQNNNTLPSFSATSGAEGVVFQPGPEVSGSLSRCSNNYIPSIQGAGVTRTIYFKAPPNAGANTAQGNTIGNVMVLGGNTGVDIESGQNNTILSLTCSGIASDGSPNATATGLVIDNACPTTGDSNNHNTILSGSFSACNRDIQNGNSSTRLLSVDYDVGNSSMSNYPAIYATNTEQLELYTGKVTSAGSSTHRPPGWSSPSRISTGVYTINHNIGNSNYTVTATPGGNNVGLAGITSIGSSSFTLTFRGHNSSSLVDVDFHYQVIAY